MFSQMLIRNNNKTVTQLIKNIVYQQCRNAPHLSYSTLPDCVDTSCPEFSACILEFFKKLFLNFFEQNKLLKFLYKN